MAASTASPHVTAQDLLSRLRPAVARIDLDRLASNYAALRAYARLPLLGMVKADAYGHGAVPVALRLEAAGAPMLAVAYVEEGLALRAGGVKAPILVLTGFGPGQLPLVHEADLTPVIGTPELLQAVLQAPPGSGRLRVHVKVDTGMTRLGFQREDFAEAAQRLADSGRVQIEGAMTHLACADEDHEFTERQLDHFDAALEELDACGLKPRWVHAANSAGLAHLRPTHTLARPGLMVYGAQTRPLAPPVAVQPVMSVAVPAMTVKDVPAGTPVSYGARWVASRPSRVATLPLGYADGVPRTDLMREHGWLMLRGQRVPVAGTVCMDLVMVDVTDVPGAASGDEAVFFGDAPTAWDVAGWAGTIAYDVMTRVGSRVPRVYLEGGRVRMIQSRYGPVVA